MISEERIVLIFSQSIAFSDELAIRRGPVIVQPTQRHRNARRVNTFLIEDAVKVNCLIILSHSEILI